MVDFCAALLLILLVAPALAEARPAISVTTRGSLPFGQAALRRAIDLRTPLISLPRAGAAVAAAVQALPGERAAIAVAGSRQVVSLQGLSGPDAARIVALLILDLVSSVEHGVTPDPRKPAPPIPEPGRLFVGLSPRLSLGVQAWSPTFEPTLDLSARLSRLFLIFVEAGLTWTRSGDGDAALTLWEVPLRAGAGLRYRWFEARAGLAVRPYWVSGAGEDSGALVGGTVGFYGRRHLVRWLLGYAAVGVDLLSRRKEFRVDGKTVLTTSWAVPWVGVGLGWQGG